MERHNVGLSLSQRHLGHRAGGSGNCKADLQRLSFWLWGSRHYEKIKCRWYTFPVRQRLEQKRSNGRPAKLCLYWQFASADHVQREPSHQTKMANNGQHPQYHVEGSHEPIIDIGTYDSVQLEIAKRVEKHTHPGQKKHTYLFTGKLVCAGCGKHYRRKVTKARPVWICPTFNTLGKASCPSKQIPEETLCHMAADALGMDVFSEEAVLSKITVVRVEKDNILVFRFKDGTESVKRWPDRSRSESWTEEMKEAARQKNRERRLGHGS